MAKRETEVLVYHALCQTDAFSRLSTYEQANVLRITEARVKTLRADAVQRYAQLDHRSAIKLMLSRFMDGSRKPPQLEGGCFLVDLPDPAERREFEFAVRYRGGVVDFANNREVVRVDVETFLTIMKRTFALGDEEFAKLWEAEAQKQDRSAELLDKARPMKDRITAYVEKHKSAAEACKTVFGVLQKVATGNPLAGLGGGAA